VKDIMSKFEDLSAKEAKDGEYKVMTAGMINLIDERLNGQEQRI